MTRSAVARLSSEFRHFSEYTCLVVVFLTTITFWVTGSILAGVVTSVGCPEAKRDRWVSLTLAVRGGIRPAELESYLDSTCLNLADRRRRGIGLLMSNAEGTQSGLLRVLAHWESLGRAANVKSHWLTNTISADLCPADVSVIAQHKDVLEVSQDSELAQIKPDDSRPQGSRASTDDEVAQNLVFIGADSAWHMGYTGEGRIVCLFDLDGVDGNHPALYGNWKGHDGDSTAAWNQWQGLSFPNAEGYHGTHLAGIMVGHDDVAGDTIGVAPGAKWIAATNALFEWAANPDGDSSTTADIPDVINFSFDFAGYCWDKYWDMIDMVEALGIVVVIAAGNRGSAPYSVSSPASRAEDSLTNFAVGSVDHRTGNVWFSSGRGPSVCDSVSIKPNVTAPGVSIRSSVPGGLYELHGGTSAAAPHVAGAVAILRQAAPNATAREIKEALLAGCTPRGAPSPNNDYGWGIINIPRSLEWLVDQQQPDVRVSAFEYDQVTVDDTLIAELTLHNRGHGVDSVYLRFSDRYDALRLLADSIYFGLMLTDRKQTSSQSLRMVFDDTVYAGAIVPVDCEIRGSGDYRDSARLWVLAGKEGRQQFFTHKNDKLQFTISNFGQYGFASESVRPLNMSGFRYGDTTRNCLWEASLVVGIDSMAVSDGWRNQLNHPDDDFWVDASHELAVYTPSASADQETYTVFDDGRAENRIGLRIGQRSMSWNNAPDDRFVIMEYEITNVTNRVIPDVYVGLVLDWNYRYPNYDNYSESGFTRRENLGYLFERRAEEDSSRFLGLAALNLEGVFSYRAIRQYSYGGTPRMGFTEAEKYNALSGGIVDTCLRAVISESLLHIMATGPFTLVPGESDTAAFAVLGANSLSEMRLTALRARYRYLSIIDKLRTPDRFLLQQNYPNPFNTETKIEYELPEPSSVKIEVFNVLGQRVATLVDREQKAGYHTVTWDSRNECGREVASGLYFYRLKAREFTKVRKMLLLK